MADLALNAQGMFQSLLETLNSLPAWIAFILLFAPALFSLYTRDPVTVLSTALLNLVCLTLLGAGPSSAVAVPIAIMAFAASVILALFGLHERVLWRNLADLEMRVGHIDARMAAFTEALEKRSDLLDERTEEARNAFREARQAYEEHRYPQPAKPPLQAAPALPPGPSANSSGTTPPRIASIGTGTPSPLSPPPIKEP